MSTGNEPTSLQPAALLHYRPYRDTSLIVDLFTLGHGRVSMIAKGARSSKPAVRALYQPFRPLLVSWIPRDGLHLLVGIEEQGAPITLQGEPLICAYYLNEILVRLLHREQAAPELFGHYLIALNALAASDAGDNSATALRVFELQLLDALGVLPEFTAADVDGAPLEPIVRYRYNVEQREATPESAMTGVGEQGVRYSGDATSAESGQHAELDVSVSGTTLFDLARAEFTSRESLHEAGKVLKRLIRLQLGDTPLNSRTLFKEFRSP